MRLPMLLQVATKRKALLAHITLVRLLPGVSLLVLHNMIPLAKILAADVALERLDAGVDELMLFVGAQVTEGSSASFTAVRFLAGMYPLMPLQILHVHTEKVSQLLFFSGCSVIG